MLFRKKLKDPELVKALKNNSEDALAQLYRDNYTSIRNYVMQHNGLSEDAEDILQEAVIAVWQLVAKPDFQLSAKLSTLVYAVAKNMWLKKLRKNMRIQYDSETVESLVAAYEPELLNEKKTIAMQLLGQLEEGCKDLLMRFYFYQQTTETIAQELGFANTDVVKSRKYQCFKKLQSLVQSRYTKQDFFN
jgi:RNA polymerase sigma factor (sigma-70 family)